MTGMDPMDNTDKVNIPILLYHGDYDVRVRSGIHRILQPDQEILPGKRISRAEANGPPVGKMAAGTQENCSGRNGTLPDHHLRNVGSFLGPVKQSKKKGQAFKGLPFFLIWTNAFNLPQRLP